MTQIKNEKGLLIGFLKDTAIQIQAFDAKGVFIGRFDKKQNRTFDKRGMSFSNTDSTVALIHSTSTTN
jgi:hypothetical protein